MKFSYSLLAIIIIFKYSNEYLTTYYLLSKSPTIYIYKFPV